MVVVVVVVVEVAGVVAVVVEVAGAVAIVEVAVVVDLVGVAVVNVAGGLVPSACDAFSVSSAGRCCRAILARWRSATDRRGGLREDDDEREGECARGRLPVTAAAEDDDDDGGDDDDAVDDSRESVRAVDDAGAVDGAGAGVGLGLCTHTFLCATSFSANGLLKGQ